MTTPRDSALYRALPKDAAPVQPSFDELVAADVANRAEGLPVVTEVVTPQVAEVVTPDVTA